MKRTSAPARTGFRGEPATWLQVMVAVDQGAASPLSTAVLPQEDAAQDGAIDLAEDMVSEQYCWLTNLVNFFAQYHGVDATCQARGSSSPWLPPVLVTGCACCPEHC